MYLRRGLGATIGGVLLLAGLTPGADAQTPGALWDDRVVGAPMVAPVVSGDTIWVAGTNRKLRSLDARTGKQHWKRTLPAHPVLAPIPAGELLIVGLGDPQAAILLLDRRNGKEKGRIRLDDRPVGILGMQGGLLFATFGGSVGARRLPDRSILWDRDLDAPVAGCAGEGRCFFVLGRSDSLWCLDSSDGGRRWSVAVEGTHSAAPVVVDSVLIRVSYEGLLVAHDPHTGRLHASSSVVAPQVSPPTSAEGRLATAAVGGEIEVFDPSSGEVHSLIESGETIAAGARAWDAWWIVPTLKGRVLAVKRSRGVTEWSLTFRDPISLPPATGKDYLALIDDRGRMVVYARRGPS